MNKNRFRVIYSQARGMFIAVAEIVKSRTKTAGQSSAASDLDSDHISSNVLNTYKKLNPIHFAVMSMLGAVIYTVPLSSIANTQIIADKTAPNSQQPIILNSSNGITQVNIQTPSAGGVSRNTYTQFDVGQEGAILNNSRNSAQTQIGGWVQGNPWLAKGEAKVILNEVNSSNPSQLKGYLEVAGKSAQVVIANPSGLVCDGCGVINADRFTLTTGQAVMNQGYLESFRVREGQVTIEGKGLNGSLTPYTDIYARALKVNAGLYANSLNVVSGQNDITVKDQATPQVNTATSNLSTTTNMPNFSLDVGQMGGMYAGKIFLVGTENGLGVRNAGSIHASTGQMTLNANGDLINKGNVIANAGEISIQAHDVKNFGNISNIQQRIQIQAENIQNSGLIVSNDQLQLNVQNGINNTGGELLAANKLTINANQLINKGKIIGEGDVDIDLKQSYTHTQDDHIAANGTLKLSTEKEIINQSVLAAGQKLELNAQKIDNQSGASISANETHLIAQDTVHNQGLINGELTHIQANKVWNDGARIYGTHVAIQANRLDNKSNTTGTGAVIASRGDMDLGIGTLNNQSGGAVKENARDNAWILSTGALNVGGSLDYNLKAQGQATAINNLSARIESLGDMTLFCTKYQ
ncbi:MAG: filamentous hemagglutinin N-terminal domain-containing protein [Acinetobacter sp.]